MGFHQITMDPESNGQPAFSTPFRHYRFNRMPFGLKNARLDQANFTLQPEKYIFLRKEVNYLRHVITQDGVKPDPKK